MGKFFVSYQLPYGAVTISDLLIKLTSTPLFKNYQVTEVVMVGTAKLLSVWLESERLFSSLFHSEGREDEV